MTTNLNNLLQQVARSVVAVFFYLLLLSLFSSSSFTNVVAAASTSTTTSTPKFIADYLVPSDTSNSIITPLDHHHHQQQQDQNYLDANVYAYSIIRLKKGSSSSSSNDGRNLIDEFSNNNNNEHDVHHRHQFQQTMNLRNYSFGGGIGGINETTIFLNSNDDNLNPAASSTAILDEIVRDLIIKIVLSIFYIFICISCVLGNILVILSVFTYKPLQSVQNIFIVSLAVADTFVAIFVMPFHIILHITNGEWLFGALICHFFISLDIMLCTASILHLCCIALDRYWAIKDSIKYAQKRTLKRVLTMILIVWISSAFISLPGIFWNSKIVGFYSSLDPNTRLDTTMVLESLKSASTASATISSSSSATSSGGVIPAPLTLNDNKETFHFVCDISKEISYRVYSSCGTFYLPLLLMTFVYVHIYLETKRRLHERAKAAKKLAKSVAHSQKNFERKNTNATEASTRTNNNSIATATTNNGCCFKLTSWCILDKGDLGDGDSTVLSSMRSKSNGSSIFRRALFSSTIRNNTNKNINRPNKQQSTVTEAAADDLGGDHLDNEASINSGLMNEASKKSTDSLKSKASSKTNAEKDKQSLKQQQHQQEVVGQKFKSVDLSLAAETFSLSRSNVDSIDLALEEQMNMAAESNDLNCTTALSNQMTSAVAEAAKTMPAKASVKRRSNLKSSPSHEDPSDNQQTPLIAEKLSPETAAKLMAANKLDESNYINASSNHSHHDESLNPVVSDNNSESKRVSIGTNTIGSSRLKVQLPAADTVSTSLNDASTQITAAPTATTPKQQQQQWVRAPVNTGMTLKQRQKISLTRERRAARTMGIIMGSFTFCWCPFFIVYLLQSFGFNFSDTLITIITWLGYVNSALNPVIYTVFNLDFRKSFKRILFGCILFKKIKY